MVLLVASRQATPKCCAIDCAKTRPNPHSRIICGPAASAFTCASAKRLARPCAAADPSCSTSSRLAVAMSGQRVAAFAWQLQQQLAHHSAATNAAGFFTSPLSLYTALGLALGAAGSHSSTQQELYKPLSQSNQLGPDHPTLTEDSDVENLLQSLSQLSTALQQGQGSAEVILANGIWTKKVEVHPEYAAHMHSLFQAEVAKAESADVINQWAARVSKGLIKQAIPPGTYYDLVLTNAVYFKGLWEYAFNKSMTSKHRFTREDDSSTQVDMMYKEFDQTPPDTPQVKFTRNNKFEAVRLPYKGTTISAVIVLPAAELSRHGVAAAAAALDIEEVLDFGRYRAVDFRGLQVYLPRFQVKTEGVSLKKHLFAMGVKDAFDSNVADLSKMLKQADGAQGGQGGLYISDVLQSVCVIVDEEGTEAAAVTSISMVIECAITPPHVVFDRPFLFMLVDDATSTPLFVGTVMDPSKGKPNKLGRRS